MDEQVFTFSFEARGDVEGMSVDFYFRDASTLISQTVYTKLTTSYERYVQPVIMKSGYRFNGTDADAAFFNALLHTIEVLAPDFKPPGTLAAIAATEYVERVVE